MAEMRFPEFFKKYSNQLEGAKIRGIGKFVNTVSEATGLPKETVSKWTFRAGRIAKSAAGLTPAGRALKITKAIKIFKQYGGKVDTYRSPRRTTYND